jgi:glucokinase
MASDGVILVADIGGTNTRLAVTGRARLGLGHVRVFSSPSFPDFGSMLRAYLTEEGIRDVRGATLAPAGPIEDDRFKPTNVAWPVTKSSDVQRLIGGGPVQLINDFEAVAYAIAHLPAGDFVPVGGGLAKPGWPMIALGPGTGLGMAYMVPVKGGRTIIQTAEAGVGSLPIQTERELAIAKHGLPPGARIITEALVAGTGLLKIYKAIGALDVVPTPLLSPSTIAEAALAGSDHVAIAALDQYLVWLGRATGDLALALRAEGGVYLAGGIPPKIVSRILSGPFRAAFDDKPPLERIAKSIAVHVVMTDKPALIGCAAAFASAHPDLLHMA